jgi:hypothetical protein
MPVVEAETALGCVGTMDSDTRLSCMSDSSMKGRKSPGRFVRWISVVDYSNFLPHRTTLPTMKNGSSRLALLSAWSRIQMKRVRIGSQ